MHYNKTIGKYGETIAADYLINNGYKILDRNTLHINVKIRYNTGTDFSLPPEMRRENEIQKERYSEVYRKICRYLQRNGLYRPGAL